jgi:hypothetical protein
MNTSPAPDVDRVLDRMGRSAFGYRSFSNSVGEAVPAPPAGIDPATPSEAMPAAPFSLIGAALPAAAQADFTPVAVGAPANPLPLQTQTPAPTQIQSPATSSDIRAVDPRMTSLAAVFRVLAGNAAVAPAWRDAGRQEASFPFRRR